jgi:hypothetical protein
MQTIQQEIESLAKLRWPLAGRIDVGSTMSHAWHGDIASPHTGFSILISTRAGGHIQRLQADSLEDLKVKVKSSEGESRHDV